MDNTPPTAESTEEMLGAMRRNLPELVKLVTGVQPDAAWNEYLARERVALPDAQLAAKVYGQVGPELNRIGREIDRANQQAASQTELELAKGTGRELVAEADRAQRQIDPEFYKLREQLSGGIEKFLGGMDPNKLSATEEEQVARGLARTGANVPQEGMATIRNAMTFGDALNQKRQLYGAALGTASQAAPALRSGVSGFEVATRRALTPNSGDARFLMPNQQAGHSGLSTAQQFQNQVADMQKIRIQKYESPLKQGVDTFKGITEGVGNLFSFGM